MSARLPDGPLGRIALLGIVLLPGLSVAMGSFELFPFLMFPAVMLIPALLFAHPTPPPGGSDDGASGESGGGGVPRTPAPPPAPPTGGVPLPDAEPGGRLRDHSGRLWSGTRARRPAREPDRTRTPSRTG